MIITYVIIRKKTRVISLRKDLFAIKHFIHSSAYVDYYLILVNGCVKLIIIAPFLYLGLEISFMINELLLDNFGLSNLNLSTMEVLIYYTIILTIFNDFLSYAIHVLLHKNSFLWEFHKVHHSATRLNPFTQYRLHPIELILSNLKGFLSFGLITGFFDYLSTNQISPYTFLGVNCLHVLFLAAGANLRHSHIRLKYNHFVELFLISPFQHQVHHSTEINHYDKNFGSKFAIWDLMFGTLIRSKEVKYRLRFGLSYKERSSFSSITLNLYQPFKNIYAFILKRNKTILNK